MKNVVLINYTHTYTHTHKLTRIHKSCRKIAGPINVIGTFLLLDLLLLLACARRFDHFSHTRESIVSRIEARRTAESVTSTVKIRCNFCRDIGHKCKYYSVPMATVSSLRQWIDQTSRILFAESFVINNILCFVLQISKIRKDNPEF